MAYQDVKDRLYRGRRKIASNTYLHLIEHDLDIPESIQMRLHGNLLAEFYHDHLELYSASWYTTTTKSRLNMALSMVGIGSRIYQHNYEWYYGRHYALDKTTGNLTSFGKSITLDYSGYILN